MAGAIVREWVSGCAYSSATHCKDTHCACRSPIFVAAGTHAALRSLKNKLDEEGTIQHILALGPSRQLHLRVHNKLTAIVTVAVVATLEGLDACSFFVCRRTHSSTF